MYRRAQKTYRDLDIPKRHYFDITIGGEENNNVKERDVEAARKNRATCNINQLILSCKEN